MSTKMRGLVHIYTGNGKGKTTAAIGLAMRFAGSGGRALIGQFLKDDSSSELSLLPGLDRIDFIPSGHYFGFTSHMDEAARRQATRHYTDYFRRLLQILPEGGYGLILLDEILVADREHFIPHAELLSFLSRKGERPEIVLTGRDASPDLISAADYVSEIKCTKHPYHQGITARKGIEY